MTNLKLFLMIAITIFALSCSKKSNEIDEGYLIELENDYNRSIGAETGDEEPFIYNDAAVVNTQDDMSRVNVSDYGSSRTLVDGSPVVRTIVATDNTSTTPTVTPAQTITPSTTAQTTAPAVNRPTQLTTFTSKWVDTQDSKIIKDVRLMIANREYTKAQNYINNLNMNNLSDTDAGHLYQFKGIVNYFLVETDTTAFSTAIDSFQKAYDLTKIDKFKPLSILWLGMLYERYSNNQAELAQALNLFDELMSKYSDTRFANDAAFYKVLVLQKLGRIEEARELTYKLETTKYPDTLVYSKWSNDYVELSRLLPRIKA